MALKLSPGFFPWPRLTMDGQRLNGVEFINPFAANAAPRLVALFKA